MLALRFFMITLIVYSIHVPLLAMEINTKHETSSSSTEKFSSFDDSTESLEESFEDSSEPTITISVELDGCLICKKNQICKHDAQFAIYNPDKLRADFTKAFTVLREFNFAHSCGHKLIAMLHCKMLEILTTESNTPFIPAHHILCVSILKEFDVSWQTDYARQLITTLFIDHIELPFKRELDSTLKKNFKKAIANLKNNFHLIRSFARKEKNDWMIKTAHKAINIILQIEKNFSKLLK